jgi:UDP-N-acetylglucosamine enolpyruvyl transferase
METLDKLIINGNKPLFGEVNISGAKNAALPLMTISLLIEKGFELNNVPDLIDTQLMNKMINELGIKSCNKLGKIQFHGKAQKIEASENLVKKMRASILILSPLLQSKKIARVPLPGGCAIGSRPIDIHLEVIKKLGATVEFKDNFLEARLPKMNFFGNNIKFPIVSVGATECAILAAVLAKGKTTLSNAAKEPEVVDLGNCLIKAGASINGLGKSEITIKWS